MSLWRVKSVVGGRILPLVEFMSCSLPVIHFVKLKEAWNKFFLRVFKALDSCWLGCEFDKNRGLGCVWVS